MALKPFIHKVQYYETDKMGITHHANYIHWLEEARIDMMEQLGYPYERLEAEGVGIPVTTISFEYKASTTFPECIRIEPRIVSFNGVILEMRYRLLRESDGCLVAQASSRHAFVEKTGRIARMKRDHAEFYELMLRLVEPED